MPDQTKRETGIGWPFRKSTHERSSRRKENPNVWSIPPSSSRSCPHGYKCLPNVGDNPNFGYTSFDNLLWAMLTTFQLITLDYWENVYNMVSIDLWSSNL